MTTIPSHRSHPTRSVLEAFAADGVAQAAESQVVSHLRSGCLACLLAVRDAMAVAGRPACEELAKGLLRDGIDDEQRLICLASYARRAERKGFVIALEAQAAPGLSAELMLRSPAARREAVRESRRYQLMGLSDALREESRAEGFRDVARAVELAELAAEVADCLDTGVYGPRLVGDARALSWAMLGNARRVAGDLFGAERALRSAREYLEHGSGGPTEEAEVLSLLASLRVDQSRFDLAIRNLETVATTYRSLGMERAEGRALFQLSYAAGIAGEPNRAIDLLYQAVELLDDDEDERLLFWAQHNIVRFLNDAGRSEEAVTALEQIRPLYDRYPDDRSMHIRRRWMEGQIAAGLGRKDEAVAALREVRTLFIEEERAFDNALITLDLAAVHLEAGEMDEVKRLAEEMYPVFRSQEVHRHAVAALILFKQAAVTEAATVGMIRDVGRYLAQARNNPYLRFEPSAP